MVKKVYLGLLFIQHTFLTLQSYAKHWAPKTVGLKLMRECSPTLRELPVQWQTDEGPDNYRTM